MQIHREDIEIEVEILMQTETEIERCTRTALLTSVKQAVGKERGTTVHQYLTGTA